MTEDPEDRGYRSTRLLGQWQLHSVSISNGDGLWPVCSPGIRGQGTATQQHRNKQKARVLCQAQSGNQKIHRTQQHNASKVRKPRNQLVCTLQKNSKVPASREQGLECTPQQHTNCAQGGGKETRLLLGVAKNKESKT